MDLNFVGGFDAAASSGAGADGELPIFSVERVQLEFSIAADFVAGQVANNVIILALSNGRILRIDLNRPEDIDGTSGRCLASHPHGMTMANECALQTSIYPRRLPRSELYGACSSILQPHT